MTKCVICCPGALQHHDYEPTTPFRIDIAQKMVARESAVVEADNDLHADRTTAYMNPAPSG